MNENCPILNILVVDDDKDLAGLVKMSLIKKHVVQMCHTLEDARQRLGDTSIHLLLLDNSLPDDKGLDFIPEIRQHLPGAKIVVISGDAPQQIEKPAIVAGAHRFVPKLFDLKMINMVIASLFGCI